MISSHFPDPISSHVKSSLSKISSDGTRTESKNLQTTDHDPNSVSAQTLSQSHSSNRHSGDMTTSVGIDVPTNVAVSGVTTGDVAAIMLGVLYIHSHHPRGHYISPYIVVILWDQEAEEDYGKSIF